MSKDKKAAFAEKQRVAGVVEARGLTPLVEGRPSTVATKKAKGRKQSRGK